MSDEKLWDESPTSRQNKKKSKIGAETYNTDLTNQNHCEELNKHFSKIGKNISSKIDPPNATFNDFLIESFPNLCTFPPTSADEIRCCNLSVGVALTAPYIYVTRTNKKRVIVAWKLGISDRSNMVLWPGCEGRREISPHAKNVRSVWFVVKRRGCCCNLSGGVALIVWFTTNGMSVKNNPIMYVAWTSNNRVILSGDLYCYLLPRCEALRTCRSGFPIATPANNCITKMQNNICNSYDMPAKFFKISASSWSSWLSEFFNKCMAKGEFPNLLKIAQITPIPKITSPKSPNVYRQISIFPLSPKFLNK